MIAERRAGLFSAVVLFLSPLRPCQRRTWIGARFSKKTSPGEGGEGRRAPTCPRGTALRPHRHSPAPPRCGTRGDRLTGKQDLGRAPSLLPPRSRWKVSAGKEGSRESVAFPDECTGFPLRCANLSHRSEAVSLKHSLPGDLTAQGDLTKCLAFCGEQHSIA